MSLINNNTYLLGYDIGDFGVFPISLVLPEITSGFFLLFKHKSNCLLFISLVRSINEKN